MKKSTLVLTALITVALLASPVYAKSNKKAKNKKAKAPAEGCINNPAPENFDVLDGFEEGLYWQAVAGNWGNGDTSISTDESTEFVTEGSTCGLFDYSASSPANAANAGDKATFFCDALAIVDFTEYKSVCLDIRNASKDKIDFVLVIQDTDWTWCQSEAQSLGVGDNMNVTFDLAALNIPDCTAVHRMAFCLFQEADGPIYVDNIRLVK